MMKQIVDCPIAATYTSKVNHILGQTMHNQDITDISKANDFQEQKNHVKAVLDQNKISVKAARDDMFENWDSIPIEAGEKHVVVNELSSLMRELREEMVEGRKPVLQKLVSELGQDVVRAALQSLREDELKAFRETGQISIAGEYFIGYRGLNSYNAI